MNESRRQASRERARSYRQRMRARGLRQVQMWLPDTRTPAFKAEARRESLLVARSRWAGDDQAFVDAIAEFNEG